jgi:hypothetical protein
MRSREEGEKARRSTAENAQSQAELEKGSAILFREARAEEVRAERCSCGLSGRLITAKSVRRLSLRVVKQTLKPEPARLAKYIMTERAQT